MNAVTREIVRLTIQREEYLDQAGADSDNLAIATLLSTLPWALAGVLNYIVRDLSWDWVLDRCLIIADQLHNRGTCSWVPGARAVFLVDPSIRDLLAVCILWLCALISAWVALPAIVFGVQLAQMRFYASIKARQIRVVLLDPELFESTQAYETFSQVPVLLGVLCTMLPESEQQDWWRQLLSFLGEADSDERAAISRSYARNYPGHYVVARRAAKEKALTAESERG